MIHNNVNVMQNFMEYVKNSYAENFVKSMLFCFAAPTIKGLKAGCLINFRRDSSDEDLRKIWKLNADKWLKPLGLNWLLLNDKTGVRNALVLIYRRELLERALCCNGACKILANEGYPLNDVEGCLKCLKKKFYDGCPHEVGLFLSYPPYDVMCFMKNKKCENLLERGYWKVYGNVKRAKRAFRKYKLAEYDAAREILGQIN
ncbi:MAG: DUF3793 family protein [Synergistaceae bacterium]|nr:DUF3793 family protein [Synergistaceae bacterium]